MIEQIFSTLRFLVLVSTEQQKNVVVQSLGENPIRYAVEVITLEEAMNEVKSIPGFGT